jgi:hypothetical protein
MKRSADDEAYRAVHTTTIKLMQWQICLSDAEFEPTTWSSVDKDCFVHQVAREIYCITSKDPTRLTKQFSICLVEFEAGWQVIGIQELQTTIVLRVINFGYPKTNLVNHISESIRRMVSGNNFTTDLSEQLHIAIVKEAY